MALYNAVWALLLVPLVAAILSFITETPRRAAQLCFAGSGLALLLSAAVLGARLTHPLQPPFQALVTFFAMSPPETALFAARFQAQVGIYVDSLSASFGFALAFVVVLVQGYALTTLRTDAGYRRFFWASSLLATAWFGLVFSPNLFNTLLIWGLGSAAVYLVVGIWWDRADAAAPARRAYAALHTADIALLLAVIFVFVKFGLFSSSLPAASGQSLVDPFGFDQFTRLAHSVVLGVVPGAALRSLAVMAAVLIFSAVLRAAQVPLHGWLTGTATSPVPSIALAVGSAGFAGAYLVARTYPLLLAALHAISALALTGAVTAVAAALVCLAQRDILRIAVLSALAQFGLVLAALGTGGYGQGLFVLFTSLLFTTLFLLASGNLVRVYRTRNIHEMGGVRGRMRATSAALIVWAGGIAGLSLATYYALSSVFENAKPAGPAVGALTRVTVALLVVIASGVMAAYAVRLLWAVLPGAPQRRRGFQPERVAEVESWLRLLTRLGSVGAVLAVIAGLPGIAPVHSGGLSIPGLSFTRFVYEYNRPTLPVDGWALLICLGVGALGAAAATLAFAPARRGAVAPLFARTERVARMVTDDFALERVGHRMGAPFVAAGEFIARFDDSITETLSDLVAQGSLLGADLVARLRSARTPLYLAGGLTIVGILALLSVLAATGHLWVHSL
jgi:NADH-quinone oxidoreductase subunit L